MNYESIRLPSNPQTALEIIMQVKSGQQGQTRLEWHSITSGNPEPMTLPPGSVLDPWDYTPAELGCPPSHGKNCIQELHKEKAILYSSPIVQPYSATHLPSFNILHFLTFPLKKNLQITHLTVDRVLACVMNSPYLTIKTNPSN